MPPAERTLLDRGELTASYYTLTGAPFGRPPRHTLAARAKAAAAAGFQSLALSPDELVHARAAGDGLEHLVAIVAEHGLRVSELEPLRGWDGEPSAESATAERLIYELADAFGARQVNVIQMVGEGVPQALVAERFAALCARASQHGLTVAFEPRANSPVSSPARAARLIEEAGAPNAGIVLDAYHFHRAGIAAAELAVLPPASIASVQLNDMHAQPVGSAGNDALEHRLVPGAGDIDLAGWLRDLAAVGIDVPIAVEAMSQELDALPIDLAAMRAAAGARAVLAAARS